MMTVGTNIQEPKIKPKNEIEVNAIEMRKFLAESFQQERTLTGKLIPKEERDNSKITKEYGPFAFEKNCSGQRPDLFDAFVFDETTGNSNQVSFVFNVDKKLYFADTESGLAEAG